MVTRCPYLSGRAGTVRTRDGRTLSTTTAGSGTVPVVLEAGMGASSLSWRPTYEALANRCRVVAYDRAGLGASGDDRRPRTLDRLVDDLEDLLVGVDDGPVVLVGHSYGGLLVRRLSARRPDLVQAVVLADPTDESATFYRSRKIRLANSGAYRVMRLLAQLGLLSRLQLRGAGARLINRACAGLDDSDRRSFAQEFFSARSLRAATAEMRQLGPALRSLGAAERALPMPVTLISAGRATKREAAIRREVLTVHAAFAAVCPSGRHVVAPESGHYLPIEAPDVLVEEITRLVHADASATLPSMRESR